MNKFKVGDIFEHENRITGKILTGKIKSIQSYEGGSTRGAYQTYEYQMLGGDDYPEFEIGSSFEMECIKLKDGKK